AAARLLRRTSRPSSFASNTERSRNWPPISMARRSRRRRCWASPPKLGVAALHGRAPGRFPAVRVPPRRLLAEDPRARRCSQPRGGLGAAHSSLAQVRDLALDRIKIDKSFVDRICLDPKIASLTRSIVDMARRLDLPCVAEGIERESPWWAAARRRCDAEKSLSN